MDFAERAELYRSIEQRVDRMLELGLVEEIKDLLASGVPETATSMQAIGYKEFVSALDCRCTIEEATADVKQASRHYAKRQLTWFRRNREINWLIRRAGQSQAEIFDAARQLCRGFDK